MEFDTLKVVLEIGLFVVIGAARLISWAKKVQGNSPASGKSVPLAQVKKSSRELSPAMRHRYLAARKAFLDSDQSSMSVESTRNLIAQANAEQYSMREIQELLNLLRSGELPPELQSSQEELPRAKNVVKAANKNSANSQHFESGGPEEIPESLKVRIKLAREAFIDPACSSEVFKQLKKHMTDHAVSLGYNKEQIRSFVKKVQKPVKKQDAHDFPAASQKVASSASQPGEQKSFLPIPTVSSKSRDRKLGGGFLGKPITAQDLREALVLRECLKRRRCFLH